MNFKGIDVCCPACRGELERPGDAEMVCRGCARRYPVVLDIPDLRLAPDPYIGFEEERAKVDKLAARFGDFDFEGFVNFYYSITSVVPPQHAQAYTRGLLAGVERARAWLDDWEAAAGGVERRSALLEIGCGTAPLLVAADGYRLRVGVDIALRWLLVAKKRMEQAGLNIPLLCAGAEALPFREPVFDCAVADSALEHLRDQPRSLAEMFRVLRPGGTLFIATPNRFSIGPDPQTGIWCGSWLPEKWTAAIVLRQGGIPPIRRLLSAGSLQSLLRDAGFTDTTIFLPRIPAAQRERFSTAIQKMVQLYEVAARLPVSRQVLEAIGPLLQAIAHKRA
jgi:ubiquinone/menaquinone biosynthesis C-methylase UbiE/uncharacterized protein YbaR (Trm112 family)